MRTAKQGKMSSGAYQPCPDDQVRLSFPAFRANLEGEMKWAITVRRTGMELPHSVFHSGIYSIKHQRREHLWDSFQSKGTRNSPGGPGRPGGPRGPVIPGIPGGKICETLSHRQVLSRPMLFEFDSLARHCVCCCCSSFWNACSPILAALRKTKLLS